MNDVHARRFPSTLHMTFMGDNTLFHTNGYFSVEGTNGNLWVTRPSSKLTLSIL